MNTTIVFNREFVEAAYRRGKVKECPAGEECEACQFLKDLMEQYGYVLDATSDEPQ